MKLNPIILSIMCSTGMLLSPVQADDMADLKAQLQTIQQQMQLLQNKIEAQETSQKNQQDATHALIENNPPLRKQNHVIHEMADSIAIGGVIEIAAANTDSDGWSGNKSSDIALDTFELGISASAGDWLTGNILFLYEDTDNDNFNVDEAYIGIANADKTPVFANIGRLYVPFGNFTSNMISDPATLTLAETREDVILLGVNMENGFYSSAYIFNGDAEKSGKHNQIDNFGANMGYAIENDNMSLDIGLGYINNIATSDGLQDLVADNPNASLQDYVGGLSLHAIATFSQINLIGEYITAMDSFEANELSSVDNKRLKPRAWNIEAAYNFSLLGKDTTFAIGYQKTEDMYFDSETTDYFKSAWLASLSFAVYENTNLSAEWRRATAYDIVKADVGNSYQDENLMQLKLSYQF